MENINSPEAELVSPIDNQLRQNHDGIFIGITPDKRIWSFDVAELRGHRDFVGFSDDEIVSNLNSASSEDLTKYGTEHPNPSIIAIYDDF